MEQNTHISLNITRTLDDLKILLFWRIIRDGNLLLLDTNYTDREYTETESTEIREVWYKLYDEYYTQTNDSRSKHELKKSADELVLMQRIKSLHDYCVLLGWLSNYKTELPAENWDKMYIDLVQGIKESNPRIKTNIFDEPINTLEKVSRYMGSLHNQLKKLTTGKQANADSAVANIYTKVVAVGTELGIQLNVENMSCNEWLAYQTTVHSRAAARRAQDKKK